MPLKRRKSRKALVKKTRRKPRKSKRTKRKTKRTKRTKSRRRRRRKQRGGEPPKYKRPEGYLDGNKECLETGNVWTKSANCPCPTGESSNAKICRTSRRKKYFPEKIGRNGFVVEDGYYGSEPTQARWISEWMNSIEDEEEREFIKKWFESGILKHVTPEEREKLENVYKDLIERRGNRLETINYIKNSGFKYPNAL